MPDEDADPAPPPVIPIENPVTVPAVPAFTPVGLGVRKVSIEVNRDTGRYAVSVTPCPYNAETWGPADAPEMTTPDLLGEILAAPDSAAKWAAVQAVQRVSGDLLTVTAYLLSLRE